MPVFLNILIFSLLAQANSTEEYCFNTSNQAIAASQKLKLILLPVDQLTLSNNCLIIQMPDHRRELIQSYLRRIDPTVAIRFSSAEIKRESCQLLVEKIKSKGAQNTTLEAPTISQVSKSDFQEQASETMRIQTLNTFELTYHQDTIVGECRHITPDRYEITLTVKKTVSPVLISQTQETSSLKTQLQLNRGEKIEIGSVIKKKSGKDHSLGFPPKTKILTSDLQSSQKVYLSLE